MTAKLWCLVLLYVTSFALADQECQGKSSSVPKLLYNLLKCVPKYGADNKCIQSYVCPNEDRAKDTCHFKGNIYKIGESIDNDLLREIPRRDCVCGPGGEYQCPFLTDGCPESWVGGYPERLCYLRRKLNQECADGQICPPFDGNAECQVNDKTYKEGEQFENPNDHCSQCVCDKGFDKKFEAPFCQTVNCTWTLFDGANNLDKHCAPFYKDLNKDCCPESWICAESKEEHHTSPVPSTNPDVLCHFGDKSMGIGDYLLQNNARNGMVKCECVVPPYLHCTTENAATKRS